ncbi:MAG: VOC family protein [Deltaproteobacteria bacterium]|nr:VOC family protein [Deltaproteobacteria bacterium]
MYKGSGVHHIGVGVNDYDTMVSFYKNTLAFENIFMEFGEEWNAMPEIFRTSYHKFKGIMFHQKAGGVLVELIRMSIPVPRPIRKEIRYGDIGVNKITIGVGDVNEFHKEMKESINFRTAPTLVQIPGWKDYHFVYAKDPEGNLIEFISGPEIQVKERFGGVWGIGVSVTDLDRSMAFYQQYTGFDSVVIEPHDRFSGLVDEVSGTEGTQVRSCVLANSNGGGMLELYELMKPRGRSIPFSTNWGDFGNLEVCLMSENIHETANFFYQEGMEFLSQPTLAVEAPDFDGWFLYIRDPDGIPIEVISLMPKQ